MRIQTYANDITTVEGFWDSESCAALINRAEQLGFADADVALATGAKRIAAIRNNLRCNFTDAELAQIMYERSQIFMPEYLETAKVCGLNERWRCYKYEPGQQFKMHRDGIFKRNEQEQSAYTWMVYLNDNFQGGFTGFSNGVNIAPQQGMLLLFPHHLKHVALAVAAGEKYVLRSDVIYATLEEIDDDSENMPVYFNTTFCDVVVETFDDFLMACGFTLVEMKTEAWVATCRYANSAGTKQVCFKYSGYPDYYAYYNITLLQERQQYNLADICLQLHPGYHIHHHQYTMLLDHDGRLLSRSQFSQRMQRHLWEMKLLCIDVLV